MARTVLLIDDDRAQFALARAHFANFHSDAYALDWAATYEEGLAKLTGGDYVACLLDYQLGERDGLQLIREAIGRGCRTPIVFLTAESADRVDIAAMNAGALDYLVKAEITPRLLERSLRYALKLGETLGALRQLATRDPLTGLLNRREFDRMLAEEEERARRFGHELTLVVADVDQFKLINDRHGHPAGDAVLHEVARRLSLQARTVDRVARLGGDEFGLILLQTDRAAGLEVARSLCAAVAGEPVRAGETLRLGITLSAGVAGLAREAGSGESLAAAADRALYRAKREGRNRAVASDANHTAGPA